MGLFKSQDGRKANYDVVVESSVAILSLLLFLRDELW